MTNFFGRLFAAIILAWLLGALILVVAYAIGCLFYLAHVPYVVGWGFLAARNSALVVLALVLGYRLCRRLHRTLRSGWPWIFIAPLAALSAAAIAVVYSYPVHALMRQDAQDVADRLRLQRGKHLHIPFWVSGVVIQDPSGRMRIILNDRLIQPLFGIDLIHMFVHEGGEIGIELAADGTVKDVETTME